MSISLSGLERYQVHQQLSQLDNPAATAEAPDGADRQDIPEDAVSLSDAVVVLEWIARQAPDLGSATSGEAASLGRLSDHLLRYDLISVPEAGRLMSLAGGEGDAGSTEPLNERILARLDHSESRLERDQWHRLGRVVSNLSAAQGATH